jgi:large subunit ribosomal protein L29
MKKREKEEIRNLGDAELESLLKETEKELFNLKFNKKIAPVDNPLKIRLLRRKIAFIKTVINQRRSKNEIGAK